MSQKTVAQLTTEINTQIATNGANAITAAVMRPVLQDMVDSAANLADGQTLYTGNGTLSGNRVVSLSTNSLEFTGGNVGGVNCDHFFSSSEATLQINNGGPGDQTKVDVQDGFISLSCSPVGAGQGIKLGLSDQKVAAFGGSPVTRPASADQAIATDPASTMALANALRSALVDLNWIKGSA